MFSNIHWSATCKPVTDKVNDTDHGYCTVFWWETLGPGIHRNVVCPIKPSRILVQTELPDSCYSVAQYNLDVGNLEVQLGALGL